MFFNKGEWYEVSGGNPNEVVYADEDVFICRATHNSPVCGLILTNDLKMFSNKTIDYKGKYWIKKIPCPEAYQTAEVSVL